jgi:ferritin-like metal-binding protein YciE
MKERDDLISWLNDAYSMEVSIAEVLENHVKDSKEHPELETRLRQHLAETKNHAERVKQAIQSLGSSVSTTKAVFADLMGKVQGRTTGMFSDELVKNMLHDYMSEHLEIASYLSLIAAAEELGETGVATVCRGILQEEESMARWMEQQIPAVTRMHLRSRLSAAR